jgi:hypothetical protein
MAGEGIGWNQNGWDTPFFRSNMTERSKPFAEEGQAKKGKKRKNSALSPGEECWSQRPSLASRAKDYQQLLAGLQRQLNLCAFW